MSGLRPHANTFLKDQVHKTESIVKDTIEREKIV